MPFSGVNSSAVQMHLLVNASISLAMLKILVCVANADFLTGFERISFTTSAVGLM